MRSTTVFGNSYNKGVNCGLAKKNMVLQVEPSSQGGRVPVLPVRGSVTQPVRKTPGTPPLAQVAAARKAGRRAQAQAAPLPEALDSSPVGFWMIIYLEHMGTWHSQPEVHPLMLPHCMLEGR